MNPTSQTDYEFRPGRLGRNALAVIVLIVVFVLAHLLLRSLVTPSLHGDDADLVIFDQSLQWGYHAQPPLYSWLYRGVSLGFGRNLLSLNILRTVLLGYTAWMTFLSMRHLVRDERLQVLGAFSALAAPAIAWHAVTYLTHSLLLFALCMTAFHATLLVVKRGAWRDYLWLGLVSGFGLLAKYNFAVFALALLGAGITLRPLRPKLLNFRMATTITIATLVFMPHLIWMLENYGAIRGEYGRKLGDPSDAGAIWALIDLVKNCLLLAAPTIAIFGAVFPHWYRPTNEPRDFSSIVESWILRYFFFAAAIYATCIVATQADKFHERWLEPIFLLLPILFICRVSRMQVPNLSLKRLGHVLIFFALLITTIRAGQLWVGNSHRGFITMDYIYNQAASELAQSATDGAIMVVDNHEIGGNLINCGESLPCVCADHSAYQPAWSKGQQEYVLVWREEEGETVPGYLADYASEELGLVSLPQSESNLVQMTPRYKNQPPKHLRYLKVRRRESIALQPDDRTVK